MLFVIATLLMSGTLHAEPRYSFTSPETTSWQGPTTAGTTKFQTLVNAYQSATQPARMEDFLNKPRKQCVGISESNQDNPFSVYVIVSCGRYSELGHGAIEVPAQPAREIPPGPGPLLLGRHEPEVPAYTIPAVEPVCDPTADNKLISGQKWVLDYEDRTYWQNFLSKEGLERYLRKFSAFENQQTETDLLILIPKNDINIFGDIGSDVRIAIRKDARTNTYPFFVSSKDETFAGYCY